MRALDGFRRRSRPLRVVIDARIRSGKPGGIEGVIIGLASGLAKLTDSDDEYVFLCIAGEESFVTPFLGSNSRVAFIAQPPPPTLMDRIRWKARRTLFGPPPPPPRQALDPNIPPFSDGTVERLRADLVHFTGQAAFQTGIPSIYHPHDIQHIHLPQFFSPELIQWREGWYRTLCHRAAMVAVASSWTKNDIERHYELPPDRVRVVRMAPPTNAFRVMTEGESRLIRDRLGVPVRYVLYPAQTWAHKNHTNLLRALARLRDLDGTIVPLVACGKQNEHFEVIREVEQSHELAGQVFWPGFVSPDELQALYDGAVAVVIPTRFEAGSFPMWEAFAAGVPVASSNVTALPEQAGDAALLFDPDDIDGMADTVRRLWTDATLRATLVDRGRQRVAELSWETTARTFRAHYRRLTGTRMTDEDLELVS